MWSSLGFRGTGQSLRGCVFSGSVSTPVALTTWPKYCSLVRKNLHFEGFNLRPKLRSWRNTISRLSRWSLKLLECTITSSKYTRHLLGWSSPRHSSIRRWNVAPAFFNPKGMRLHSQKPRPLMENAVFCLSSSANGTCQYPLFKSSAENQRDPPSASNVSSIRGTGYASAGVRALMRLRSIQNLSEPSFFRTRTTGEEYGLSEGLMAPHSYISRRCCLTSSYIAGGTVVVLERKGVWSVWGMRCCRFRVQPISGPCLAKVLSHRCSTWPASALRASSSATSPRSKDGVLSEFSMTSAPDAINVTCSRQHRVLPLVRVMVFWLPFFTSMNIFFTGSSSGVSTRRGSTIKGDFFDFEVRLWRHLTVVCPSSRAASPGASCICELVTSWTLTLGLEVEAWKVSKAMCQAGWTCVFSQNLVPEWSTPCM